MRVPDAFLLNHHSMDAYFFVRYFRVLVVICLIGWPLTWAALMPIYATSHGGQEQFDLLSFSNINTAQDANRLYAPALVAWIFLGM